MNYLAQNGIPVAPKGGFKGFGSLGLENNDVSSANQIFATFISSTVGIITVIAIIWFVFLVLTGSVSIMTAGSDKGAVEAARKKLTNGLIGLVVTVFGIFLIRFVGYLIGIPDILNIDALITNISGK